MKKKIILSLVTVFVLLDQISKFLIIKYSPNIDLKLFTIISVRNTGAGFGILQGQTFYLGLISLAVTGGLIYYYPKIPKDKWTQIFYTLFLGGTIGNMLDRFFRGYVIDFINFSWWPAFNIADSCLTIAVTGFIIHQIVIEIKSKKKQK